MARQQETAKAHMDALALKERQDRETARLEQAVALRRKALAELLGDRSVADWRAGLMNTATRSSLLMMLQRNGPWDRLVNLRVGVKKILWE